ncbi:Hypothetical predicted protein [Pelobates cultripes]|uniref:Reverse transcriptase n=1 Tax=Pelobates cultripes TaxID=61616 RepID=A0AAD1WTH5_PELCU|nr:Hypothetical predicted protein [Pelobates cultripes]
MAFPHVKTYHQAAILTSLLAHLTIKGQPQWVRMENQAIALLRVSNLMWLRKTIRPTTTTMPSQLSLALNIWDQYRSHFESQCPLSLATPTEALTYCIPTFHATPWKERGATHLAHLYKEGKLLPFLDLRRLYNIPPTSHYSHIQLQSFLHKHNREQAQKRDGGEELTTWEKIGITGIPSPKFKPLSECYKSIHSYQPFHSSTQAQHWSTDLNVNITEHKWKHIATSVRKLVKSAPLLEQHQKTIYRWYMVPTRLHRLYPHSPPTCWRCAGDLGSVLHIWWRCPKLERYWKEVRQLITQTTKTDIALEPSTFLLLDIPPDLPATIKKLIYHILLTAQRVIARSWKSTRPPSVSHIIQDVDKQLIYETQYSAAHTRPQRWGGAWELWSSWTQKTTGHLVQQHH